MTLPAPIGAALDSMPWVSIGRARMAERGRYYHHHSAALLRSGLRGPAYFVALMHELIHAERGDTPCADAASEAQQELAVTKETARRLIDVHRLADVAAAFPDDAHRVAEELDVTHDLLVVRMKWLHPSERHYLRRRVASSTGDDHEQESD